MVWKLIQLEKQGDFDKVVKFMEEQGMSFKVDYPTDFFYKEEASYRLELFLEDGKIEEELADEIIKEAEERLEDYLRGEDIIDGDKSFELANDFLQEFFEEKGINVDL